MPQFQNCQNDTGFKFLQNHHKTFMGNNILINFFAQIKFWNEPYGEEKKVTIWSKFFF